MASHMAPLGVLKYQAENGQSVTFPGETHCSISSKVIKTSDGRGVKYVEHTLTATGWVYSADLVSSSGTVDNAFALARKILSQSGGKLTITGKGFGDYRINYNSATDRDINFGPHPEVVEWEPFGNVSCRFTWVCVFRLPWKDSAYTRGGILDYSWTTTYDYDEQGFCTRTTNGELEIAATREIAGDTRISRLQNIENYIFDYIICSCPVGWRRKSHNIQINNSKTKATVTFVDEPEAGLIYPPGIVDMDITHKMSSSVSNMTLANWTWSFQVTATPSALYNPVVGYQACLAAHQARWLFMVKRLISSTGVIIPMPIQFEITERVKQRTTSLTAVWMLTAQGSKAAGTFSPTDILVRSGLWQPFPWRSDVANAAASVPLGPNSTGGYSKLLSDPSQNFIIDVSSVIPKIPDIGAARGNPTFINRPNEDLLIQAPFGAYIEFKAWVSCYVHGGQWVNYPLTPGNNGGRAGTNIQSIGAYNKYRFEGKIARIGLPPAGIPVLKNVGNVKLTQSSSEQSIIKTYPAVTSGGMVIWVTEFSIPYTATTKEQSNPVKHTGSLGKKPGNTVLKIKDGELVEVPNDMSIE